MQSEQKKEFLLTGAYYAVLAAALYLFLRYLLWWLLPFLLAFAAARAMEPVILLLRRTVHFKRGFSAALLTLFLLFLLGGLLSLLLSALFTEATAFLTQLPTLLDALPALTGGLLDRLRAYGALCPDWLRELLTAELSDWAAYGSTALAGLASRALALLGSMAAAVPALVLFAATTLLAAFLITLVDALPVFGTGTVLIPWALAELLLGSVPRGAALVILYLCTLTVRSITEPKLVAAQAGLPPIASLMAMYLGARAFGVAGMVLFPLLLLLAAQMLRTKKEGSM